MATKVSSATAGLATTVEGIDRARQVIDPVFTSSPQFVDEGLSDIFGLRVILKIETVNPVRSFKGRGGDYLAKVADAGPALACASAGNLGQGLAFGARARGLALHVFAAASANPLKLARMRQFDAHLHLVDGDFDAAKVTAAREAERAGWRLVEDGRDHELADGAGTMAAELTDEYGQRLDEVLVPVGNGSLACGVGTWIKAVSPHTRVTAVGSTASPSMHRAWSSGDLTAGAPITTMAEGLAARVPVPPAIACMRGVVDDYVLVEERELLYAMSLLWDSCGLPTEPSGAAAVAAVAVVARHRPSTRVAAIVGGANVTLDLLTAATQTHLDAGMR